MGKSEYCPHLQKIQSTPTYFILDSEKTLIAKPESDKEVVEISRKLKDFKSFIVLKASYLLVRHSLESKFSFVVEITRKETIPSQAETLKNENN